MRLSVCLDPARPWADATLVLGASYRHPAVVAKMAATLDHVSGGRLTLGLGAGWPPNEHTAYGIELWPAPARLAR